MSLYAVFMLVFVLAVINALAGTASLHGFLSRTAAIASRPDLEAFKGVVRTQMYQALLQMGLLAASLVLGLAGLVSGRLGLLLVLAVNGVILALGLYGKRFETRARSLPVPDPSLADEYRRVGNVWLQKPLPDF